MDFVPDTPSDFRRSEYWDAVFGCKGSGSFEWYGDYEDFADIFRDYLISERRATRENDKDKEKVREDARVSHKPSSETGVGPAVVGSTGAEGTRTQGVAEQTRITAETANSKKAFPCSDDRDCTVLRLGSEPRILHVGCGNSELPERLTNSGYGEIVNVDFSSVVIERMKRKYRHVPNLSWECFDVRGGALERHYGEEAFDAVVDKGFFDALVSRDTAEEHRWHDVEKQRCPADMGTTSAKREDTNAESSDTPSNCGGMQGAAGTSDSTQQGTRGCQKAREDRLELSPYGNEAQAYLLSALKVLKTGGVFIIITLAQDYVVKELVRGFYAANVDIIIHPLPVATFWKRVAKGAVKPQSLLPFVFCVQKRHGPTSARQRISLAAQTLRDSGETKRLDGPLAARCTLKGELGRAACDDVFVIWDLPKKIRAVIEWRCLRLALRACEPGTRSVVSIHGSGIQSLDTRTDEVPRYVVTVYDVEEPVEQKKEKTYTRATAAILASPGEERCWLFATAEGNAELAKQAGAKRILIVTSEGGASNDGSEAGGSGAASNADVQRVSEELGPYLADLALPDSGDIPIMMVGNGTTRVVAERARERSDYAGWITVRDVEVSDDEKPFDAPDPAGLAKPSQNSRSKRRQTRRNANPPKKQSGRKALCRQLLFYCNPHTVQCEVKLSAPAPTRGRCGRDALSTFAFLQPVCGYHIPAAAAFALLKKGHEPKANVVEALEAAQSSQISAVVLGLGGGVLSMFLHSLLGEALSLQLTSVDIDPVVVEIARKHFGFREIPGRLHLVVDDAAAYVKRLPSKSVHIIIVDINSGSPTRALRCPAENFVSEDVLAIMKAALAPGGLLVFNLLCRCLKTRNEVFERLSAVFPSLSSIPISEDANEIVVCQVDGPHVELPGCSADIDRHVRELVNILESYASTCERDREDIKKCAVRLLNCAKEWRVQTCRKPVYPSTG